MVRYRWYLLLTKKNIGHIFSQISTLTFSNNKKKGFKIEHKSKHSISGTFYHISSLDQDNLKIELLNAIQFSISLIKGSIYLRLQDPTRSIKELSNTLFELCDLDLAFDPVSISFDNIKNWILSRNYYAILNLVKISNLKITDNIFSEIILKSDNEIKLLELDILKSKQYTIHSMSWSIVISGRSYRISISKLGLINISEYLLLDFIDYIESQIL